MPAPARISVPVKQAAPFKPTSTASPKTAPSIPRPKARVVHRRRARARLDDTDTDEELVREPHTDSESDSPSSTLDSESESVSDSDLDEVKSADRIPSPPHTPPVNGATSSPSPPPPAKVSAFPQSVNWSEMVAEENANGAADLPVIDFADLSSHTQAASPPATSPPSPPPPPPGRGEPSQNATGSPSPVPTRKLGQSARQAYLNRLDNDPAYVPTLGQFWSHDDRLLDKDLRSLSGWWRGRWQGRGGARGRGVFPGRWGMRGGLRGRGRGGFMGSGASFPNEEIMEEEEAAPVDRAWTHDGFEEMKKVEEERRRQFQPRGRGTFPRGRVGLRGGFPARGGFASTPRSSSPHGSQTRPQSESQQSPSSDTLRFGNGKRPWFAMKPERVWTKQFDGYLYFEAQLKPVHNQGLGQGVRVKLPGKNDPSAGADAGDRAVVVRLPHRPALQSKSASTAPKDSPDERAFTVKLPSAKRAEKMNAYLSMTPEDVTTGAPPPMEDVVPRLRSKPAQSRLVHGAPAFVPSDPPVPTSKLPSDLAASMSHPSTSAVVPVEQPAEAPRTRRYSVGSASASEFAFPGPSQSASQDAQKEADLANGAVPQPQTQPPVLPQLATSTPPFQSSPPYGSPYGYATPGPPLPPGIAVSESGVTYEISTGRAVYLQTPPPPPLPPQMQVPMYNPRPMPMHHAHHGSLHFLPPPPPSHHAHGPSMSMSPEFLPSPGNGAPIFTLPRQSSRIEIRAPGEERREKGKEREHESEHRNAGGRSAVNVNAEPFTPASAQQHTQPQHMGYYPPEAQQAFGEAQQHHQQHPSMSYQPTPYYYLGPEGGAPYGYGQYSVDAGQPQQYEAYPQDSTYLQQHAVYY